MAVTKNLVNIGDANITGDLTAGKISKSGGTSNQFLKADGSVDSTSYISTAGTALSKSGATLNHSNYTTAGTAGTSSATSGSTLAVPYVTYNAQGHITTAGTHTHTITGFATSGHNHDSTYLKLTGGTMTGAAPLNFTENNVAINFRPESSSFYSKVEYMTYGNEALIFANKNAATSFIFKCGLDLANGSDWASVVPTPSLQIKNQSVYINELIPSGTTPSYNFQVNGSSNFKGDVTVTDSVSAANGFFQTSDITKKNILGELDLDKAYDLIDKCQTIIYSLKDDESNKEQIGLIAQEVKEFFPEIISESEDGTLSLDYSRLTVVILKVLKDLIKRVSKLEEKTEKED